MIILRQMLESATVRTHRKDNLLLEDQGKIPFPDYNLESWGRWSSISLKSWLAIGSHLPLFRVYVSKKLAYLLWKSVGSLKMLLVGSLMIALHDTKVSLRPLLWQHYDFYYIHTHTRNLAISIVFHCIDLHVTDNILRI